MCKIDSQWEFSVWFRKLKQGLCINLEEWDGEGDGREVQKGIYIYLWLIHVEVWQKTAKFCKAIILQLKKKKTGGIVYFPFTSETFWNFQCFNSSSQSVACVEDVLCTKDQNRLWGGWDRMGVLNKFIDNIISGLRNRSSSLGEKNIPQTRCLYHWVKFWKAFVHISVC